MHFLKSLKNQNLHNLNTNIFGMNHRKKNWSNLIASHCSSVVSRKKEEKYPSPYKINNLTAFY